MVEQIPREIPHKTNDLVIRCMDHRFHRFAREHLATELDIDLDRSDQLTDAGASKAIVSGGLSERCPLAHKLHEIEQIIIYDHIDCGAFGGLKAFGGDEQKELEAHFESQNRAREVISNLLPKLIVRTFVINLDGEVISISAEA